MVNFYNHDPEVKQILPSLSWREANPLDTFTLRGAAALRSSGRNACVTVTTPKTLVSHTVRISSTEQMLGRLEAMISSNVLPGVPAFEMAALLTSSAAGRSPAGPFRQHLVWPRL